MNIEALEASIMTSPIMASDGNHSARVLRIAENLAGLPQRDAADDGQDRTAQIMSRVSVLARSMATDLRSGFLTPRDAARLLDDLASVGDLCFRRG